MRESKKKLSPFSKRLKEARKGIYTQQQLATESNVALKTIQRLETLPNDGTSYSPLAIHLLQLSQALDVTPEWLLNGNEQMDIYMNQIKEELKNLSIEEIRYYHSQPLTDKVLSHLKLTDDFITDLQQYWIQNTISCYRPYVQDTIIRYCHHRPKTKRQTS